MEKENDKTAIKIEEAIELIDYFHKNTFGYKNSRNMSWIHCYKLFLEKRKKGKKVYKDEELDYLSLNLAFYLASWGMLRNSFLQQKDYKVHKEIIKIILEEYDDLFEITAEELYDEKYEKIDDLTNRIKDYYENKVETSLGYERNHVTDTLATKILLGTLGCAPAYDNFFKNSVAKHGISKKSFDKESLRSIAKFYMSNSRFEEKRKELNKGLKKYGIEYTPMKIMDMCFWQEGYNDYLIEQAEKARLKKEKELLNK